LKDKKLLFTNRNSFYKFNKNFQILVKENFHEALTVNNKNLKDCPIFEVSKERGKNP